MAYHHGDLRRALLQGAIELLAEGGPANLTMRGAAQRAGVSPAAPYRHFTDKRAMLAAVAEEGFLALERSCLSAVADGVEAPIEAFWHRGVAYVQFAIENPAHYRVMFGPEIPDKREYDDLYRAASTAYEALRSSLLACVSAGFFGEDEVEIRAMRAWAVVHGLASLFIDGQFNVQDAISKQAFLVRVGAVLRLEAQVLEKGA
ncbi:MAG: TetR/AcrR family transcriptional regulator [Candidatus Binatia bacterium]